MPTIEPYILSRDTAPPFWLIDNLWMPLATGSLTGNRLALIEQVCATGIGGPPTHTHSSDEGFYVLEGGCTFQAGGETIRAESGTFVSVPRDTHHSFQVDTPDTRVLNFYTPAGFEMILISIAAPALVRTAPPPQAVPLPTRPMVEALSRLYGQTAVLGLPFVDMPTEANSLTQQSKTNSTRPFASSVKTAPAYWQEGILWSVLATKEQTGGSFSLLEQLCPLGSGPPPHMHGQDEAFYVIEGEITFQAGALLQTVGAGTFLYIPRDTAHSFRVDSATARVLNFYFPGGFEKTVTTFGEPARTLTLPPKGPQANYEGDLLASIFREVGLRRIAGPDFLRA